MLDVTVNGAIMGSELPAGACGTPPLVRVACRGTNGIDHARIIKNGWPVHTVACHGHRSCELEWADSAYEDGQAACYYVRMVQVDRESAWSSPIWIG